MDYMEERKYACPNCGKAFARDDLLRRHLAREARAAAQPQYDRQKSCLECARSKARCDLEVPSCGRCRSRGKSCTYGARSGNPNVRRQRESVAPSSDLADMSLSHGNWGVPGYQTESTTSSRRHSTDESGSESSGMAWSDGRPGFGQRTWSGASSSHSHSNSTSQDHSSGFTPLIDSSNIITPTTYLSRHAMGNAQGPHDAGLMSNLGHPGQHYRQEEGEETPIGRFVSQFHGMGPPMGFRHNGEHDRRSNSMGPQVSAGVSTSGPWTDATHVTSQSPQVHFGEMPPPPLPPLNRQGAAAALQRQKQRPQPHRLLTGANLPQPGPGGLQHQQGGPMSGKPLFSAVFDLSGWLEEPVVPSPLYPTGPSLASLGPAIPTGPMSASGSGMQQQSMSTASGSQPSSEQQPNMPASQYWWSNPPSQSDVGLMQSVAQATAMHLSCYPQLMVLPDPSSPVPPTIHRPWMANIRGALPPSLAIARVVLAGHAVRLPASEHVVWESLARETRGLIGAHEAIRNSGSDLEVFGATEALFLYAILLMMCTDPGAAAHVDMSLVNSTFFALSQLAKTLTVRVKAMQQRNASIGPTVTPDWTAWGFEETMRRTLWAAYAILVLQRFRDGAVLSEGHLAGIDLIMDVHLPAEAAEFEAATQEAWLQAQSTQSSKAKYTFRDLLRYRPRDNAAAPYSGDGSVAGKLQPDDGKQTLAAPQSLLDYFSRHDAFVATVLSIAFCLDSSLTI